MAKKSIRAREAKKGLLVEKYKERRSALKITIKSSQDFEEIMKAQLALARLPLNSNPVRHTTRCQQCGRSHGVYRKFELCRVCLRQQLMAGNVPGGRMASW